MTQLAQPPQAEPVEEQVALERTRRVWPWIAAGLVVVAGLAFAATQMLGQSVVYYKTPTEVKSAPGQHVRLAGTLVKDSVQIGSSGSGSTSFTLTDGRTQIHVVYQGQATTAISTASQPGTQLVAEGSLGTDGLFHSDVLLAKCPSKFQSGGGASAASQ